MKITFMLPYAGIAGGVRVVATYAELLQARGHDVSIVSTEYRWPRRRERLINRWRRIMWRVRGIEEPTHLRDINVPHTRVEHVGPLTDRDVPDADVVIATWWETIEWMRDLSPAKGVRVAFMQGYESQTNQPMERVRGAWGGPEMKIVIARWLQQMVHDDFGDATAILVPNSVDLKRFNAPERKRNEAPTIGFMYSDKALKGSQLCVSAIEHARNTLPGLRVIAFGVEPEEAASNLPPGTTYHHLPPQTELPRIYASCDAWLFGSREEGFGLPILEAMACRTPVIATPAGAAPELLEDGGGRLLGSHDASDMAAAIVDVMALDAPSWRQMSNDAYEIATSYSWDDAAGRFECALVEAVQREQRVTAATH